LPEWTHTLEVVVHAWRTSTTTTYSRLAPLRQIWRRDAARSEIGFAQDRSGIYGGFHCCGRR